MAETAAFMLAASTNLDTTDNDNNQLLGDISQNRVYNAEEITLLKEPLVSKKGPDPPKKKRGRPSLRKSVNNSPQTLAGANS